MGDAHPETGQTLLYKAAVMNLPEFIDELFECLGKSLDLLVKECKRKRADQIPFLPPLCHRGHYVNTYCAAKDTHDLETAAHICCKLGHTDVLRIISEFAGPSSINCTTTNGEKCFYDTLKWL